MNPRDLLITGAEELGVHLTSGQVDAVFTHLAELRKWNRRINLTAIKGERDIVIKHVLDSLSYRKGFTPTPGLRLLDMGSGAGFPAIPLKIAYPGIAITLVESIKKKASFLRHIIRTLSLAEAEVVDTRVEEIPESSRSSYDVITARAFASMHEAIMAGKAFVKPGGLIVLSRGSEETIADRELAAAGILPDKKIEFLLPHSDYKRAVWVFKKPE